LSASTSSSYERFPYTEGPGKQPPKILFKVGLLSVLLGTFLGVYGVISRTSLSTPQQFGLGATGYFLTAVCPIVLLLLIDIKDKTEIDELVDSAGTLNGSNMPIINQKLSPKKTMDQTVVAARMSNDPVTRGYRVYWGESDDEQDNVVSEVDYSEAFGYEETKDKDFEGTVKTLKTMGVDDPVGRAEEMGKDPKLDKRKVKGSFVRQRLSEKDTLEEIQKKEMIKMVEDTLTKKKKNNSDVVTKDPNKGVSQFLIKNLKSIRALAEKEGVNLNDLIKALKYNE
jgi:hypothetical protein